MPATTEYDITVVGAGIHGAGVAQAAAAAGYKTLVLEQYQQPGQATSSRSSKLIHGGLRYLETAQFELVWECLQERRRLLRNAPNLVKLVPFLIPVYKHTHRGPIAIALGLILYTILGGKGFKRIQRSKWGQLDSVKIEGLKAVFQYYDAQTDDQVLTQAVLQSAEQLGAEVKLGCEFQSSRVNQAGCSVEYQLDGRSHEIETGVLINAAGPWINRALERINPPPRQLEIDLIQGSHILIPGRLEYGVYYLEAPQDQRAVLVMPWDNAILIGTTETRYQGDPANTSPTESEIDYLLDVYNHYFSASVTPAEIITSFAGLRVLKREQSRVFHRSRETILHVDKQNCTRVLSIYGGKLSSYRATGEKVIKRIAHLLPNRSSKADTRTLSLPN